MAGARQAEASAVSLETETALASPFLPTKPTLITVPVSNCCARIRFVVYKKGLDLEIDFLRPKDPPFGGLKTPAYLALNPQGVVGGGVLGL